MNSDERIAFGKTRRTVSEICLGTMMFSDHCHEVKGDRIVLAALDSGVDFLGTVPMYCDGMTEGIRMLARRFTSVVNPQSSAKYRGIVSIPFRCGEKGVPSCHPERGEGTQTPCANGGLGREILRFAQNDSLETAWVQL